VTVLFLTLRIKRIVVKEVVIVVIVEAAAISIIVDFVVGPIFD
jgi:hypothetical protein